MLLTEITEKIQKLRDRYEYILKKRDLKKLLEEKARLENETTNSNFWKDNNNAQGKMQELGGIQAEIDELEKLKTGLKSLEEIIQENFSEEDTDLIKITEEELISLEKIFEKAELKTFLSGKFDKCNAIVKIVAGQGGTEACDWTSMLFRMYLRYANSQGWKVTVTDQVDGTEAGYASITMGIYALYAYGLLKHEHGTHRLVRNSPFNSQGLRQTSFAGVEVMPVVDEEIDIEINEKDLEFSAVRSSGAGGQNVNKVASKVRIVHKPTGIVIESSSQRTQPANREIAMRTLKAKLYEIKEQKNKKEMANVKGEYKIAGWGNQIRNYVLQPYTLVKDVRTAIETPDAEGVLNGNIQQFIDAEVRML